MAACSDRSLWCLASADIQPSSSMASMPARTFLRDRFQLVALPSLVEHRAVHQARCVAQLHLRARVGLLHGSPTWLVASAKESTVLEARHERCTEHSISWSLLRPPHVAPRPTDAVAPQHEPQMDAGFERKMLDIGNERVRVQYPNAMRTCLSCSSYVLCIYVLRLHEKCDPQPNQTQKWSTGIIMHRTRSEDEAASDESGTRPA